MNNASTLWEEKNSIGQSMKFDHKVIFDQNDIIKNIKTKSNENVCNDIGNNNPQKRNHIGKKFGTVTVINQYYNKPDRNLRVDVECECGLIEINKAFRHIVKRTKCFHLPKQGSALRSLRLGYVRGANKRKLNFELTETEFSKITKQNCFYCGESPNRTIKSNYKSDISDVYVYNGIDRIDNAVGYTIENCVPCCKNCNYFKADLSPMEFLNHVNKIYEYQNLNNYE